LIKPGSVPKPGAIHSFSRAHGCTLRQASQARADRSAPDAAGIARSSAAKSLPDASKSAAGPGLVDASSGMLTVMNELFRQANDLAAIAR